MNIHLKRGHVEQQGADDNSEFFVTPIPIHEQARRLVLFLSALYFFPLVVLVGLVVVHRETGVGFIYFMRDPAALMGVNPFLGVVSNLGVLVWCASAAICFFSWSVLRNRFRISEFANFVFSAGLLSALLLADDFFELHEVVFPQYLSIPETFTYAVYGLSAVALLSAFRTCILKTEYLLLLLSLGFLGSSLMSDVFQSRIELLLGEWRILWEDGLKFFGIVGWFGYFSRSCFKAIHRNTAK